MQPFFDSVSQAFARNQASVPFFWAFVVVLGLALAARSMWVSRRQVSQHLEALMQTSGLSLVEFGALRALAARAEVPIDDAIASLAAFERVTAQALVDQTDAALIHRLRSHLMFDRLPRWAPLFSSRELREGVEVALGAENQSASVLRIDERVLTLALETEPTTAKVAQVFVIHGGEAKYHLRCPVIRSTPIAGGWELELQHDEAPERIQLRSYARVPGRNTAVMMTPVKSHEVAIRARLIDVSAGGALVRATQPLPVGELVDAAFSIGKHDFSGVGAVVVGGSPNRLGGTFDVHLEFSGIDTELRDRLVGSVNALVVGERFDVVRGS